VENGVQAHAAALRRARKGRQGSCRNGRHDRRGAPDQSDHCQTQT
jgi:hypothetical protein